MSFRRSARVVLLQDIYAASDGSLIERAGARGVVQRDTGSFVIVRFIASGYTISVRSDRLRNENAALLKGEA